MKSHKTLEEAIEKRIASPYKWHHKVSTKSRIPLKKNKDTSNKARKSYSRPSPSGIPKRA